MADFKVVTSGYLTVQISTSKADISFNERRFPKDITVSELKAKLELATGASTSTMQVEAYNKDNHLVCKLSDDNALLGSYPIDEGMRLHVVDTFSLCNELDFANVEKYEMDPEMYAKRNDTVRSFLLKNKLGQYNEEYQKKKHMRQEEEKKLTDSVVIGSRCKVNVPNAPTRLGTVMYTGLVETLDGLWVGIKYDEPLGKHDGTFKEKEYFKCANNYGGFVKPHHVLCGDFPEDDYDLEDEI